MRAELRQRFADFRNEQSGSIAVLFGLLAIPMVLFVGLAVDYSRALSADRDLQEAVDAATIAAAKWKMDKFQNGNNQTGGDGTITQTELSSAKQVALDYLNKNFAGTRVKQLAPDAIEGESNLSVTASAEVPATFGSLLVDSFKIQAHAAVNISGNSAPLCILGLNQAAGDTVKGWGSSQLIAPDCAVVSNSTSPTGLVAGTAATMQANIFCSAGGHSGTTFSPAPQDKCPPMDDPFADQFSAAALVAKGLNVYAPCDETSEARPTNGQRYDVGGNGIFVFCQGMRIQQGRTVYFGPGVFIIYGTLIVNGATTLSATEGTTLIFADKSWSTLHNVVDGHLWVSGTGSLQLVAPTSGPTAGMAILQPSVSFYTGGTTNANEHTITGGGDIDIIGHWYTPQSKATMTGNGVINATNGYFSMVADFVNLEGNGTLQIHAGGNASGYGMTGMPGGGVSFGGAISMVE